MLTKEDFAASYRALLANQYESAYKSIVYYNSGPDAGASQKHKHLQSFDLSEENTCTSVYQLIDEEVSKSLGGSYGITTFSGFNGYKHLIYKFKKLDNSNIENLDLLDKFIMDQVWENGYVSIMKELGVFDDTKNDCPCKFDYNMIMSDNWIMVCLRRQEKAFGKFASNACGVLGGLLVKDQES